MKLGLLYVHDEAIGYGRMGVNIAKELKAAGWTIYDHLPQPGEGLRSDEHLQGHIGGIADVVCWCSVPSHAAGWYKNQRPVLFSMWESGRLPESFRENLHEFDTIIVPSEQNVELFGRYHGNVRLCYLGVDPELWHYAPRQRDDRFFNFLVAGSGSRKGTDLAWTAYRLAFRDRKLDGPLPRLLMKNPRGEDFYGDNVEIISGKLTAEDEVGLYERSHCYIGASRGEGFGLQPLQAIAQGCPTILTDAHGHAGFAHLGIPISAKPATSDYFIYGDAGQWWEPDLDEMVDAMRWVYDNYGQAQDDAEEAAQHVAKDWTWANTAQRFAAIIGDSDDLKDPGDWYEPTRQMFKVVTTRNYACEVANQHYQFMAGEEAWVVADVKRLLFEAHGGLLDPSCLSDDAGLVPEQIARLGDYLERQQYCRACHQRFGSGELRYGDVPDAG